MTTDEADHSLCALLRLSAPAILNNVAAPLCSALKLSMLGHHASASARTATASVAAFAGVSAVVDFSSNISNFVVVVSMARVGQARGANDMHALATSMPSAVAAAAGIGCLFAIVLWLCREHMLDLTSVSSNPEAASIARAYAPYALAALPPSMLLSVCRSILVGLGALATASTLATAAAVADAVAFSLLLVHWGEGLPAAAAASLIVALVAAATGLCLVLCIAPPPVRRRMLPHLPAPARRAPRLLEPLHPDLQHAADRRRQPGEGAGSNSGAGGVSYPEAGTGNNRVAGAVRTPATGGDSGAEPRIDGESETPRSIPSPAPRSILSPEPGPILSLVKDSANMFARSLLLSGSILGLTAAVGYCGGAPALAAHAVLMQLWMITSYFSDGFADVGTMLGSRFLGASHPHRMRPLSLRLALLAAATGLAAAGGMAGGRVWLIGVFTRDEQAGEMLRVAWPMLCILQPINALVFVYDGILYATMSFRYGRDALAIGVLLLFTPALLFTVKTLGGAVPTSAPRLNEPEPGLAAGSAFSAGGADTLFRLWLCKALLNCWRCLTALFRIHVMLWPKWRPVAQPTREGMATA